MKYSIIMTTLIFLIMMISIAHCQEGKIFLDKDAYSPSDKNIDLNIHIMNNRSETVTWDVDYFMVHKEDLYSFGRNIKTITLTPKEDTNITDTYSIDETIPSGEYIISVIIWDGNDRLSEMDHTFNIEDTLKDLDMDIMTCNTTTCEYQKNIFYIGDIIYIDSFSGIDNIELDTEISIPDGTKQDMDLPSEIMAEKEGIYDIEIKASKKGYSSSEFSSSFVVIDKTPEIKKVKRCDSDSICEDEENYKNCPQDCPSGSNDGYCDSISDDICDPDCQRNEDIDCLCNYDTACDIGYENYNNCPSDCPSGSHDNYCDGIKDNICDDDCDCDEDSDCKDCNEIKTTYNDPIKTKDGSSYQSLENALKRIEKISEDPYNQKMFVISGLIIFSLILWSLSYHQK